MKNLLTFILIHLVQYPDDVEVVEQTSDYGDEYLIKVNPEDIGKVIGKHGSIIQAIRTLAKVRAIKEQRKVFINIYEPDKE